MASNTKKLGGYEFWRTVLHSAKLVVAPMVDQSELAWRMLSRRYGAELCYTPMLHAKLFEEQAGYRRENFSTCQEDRPLIVQFCANNPETLLRAARHVEHCCDAVDLNLGCPQAIAKKGHYGAFLQDEWDLIASIVSLLHRELSIPITCKIRVFEDIDKTVRYAKMLEEAGCQLLTVHGRLREQRGPKTGLASWNHIKAIKENLRIPVFANGNIQFLRDVERCMRETGVDGVMCAEGNLYNPTIFTGEQPPCWRVAEEYLSLAKTYSAPMSAVRGHMFKLWLHVLNQPEYSMFKDSFGTAKNLQEIGQISQALKSVLMNSLTEQHINEPFTLDNIPFWRCQSYVRPSEESRKSNRCVRTAHEEEELAARRLKRKMEKKRHVKATRQRGPRSYPCKSCFVNAKGLKCVYLLCKKCCKVKCKTEDVDCSGHRFHSKLLKRSVSELFQPHPQPVTNTT